MRGYAPIFLLAAAAIAAPVAPDLDEIPKHSAGTCAPVSTNSTTELKAAVSSLLSNTKVTDSFPDALTALLANGSTNGTADAGSAESGSSSSDDGSGSSTDATSSDDSTSTDFEPPSPGDSTSSDDSSAPPDSSSSGESGQAVPAASSGRLSALKKAVAKLRGSHGASGETPDESPSGSSGDASGDGSGSSTAEAPGAPEGGASGGASGDAPSGPPGLHLPGGGGGMGMLGALHPHGSPPMGGPSDRHGPGPLGAVDKRQAASSLDDVVGLDLNNLSEEQLKELDGENVAARDLAHHTDGGRLSQRDAEPTAVAARDPHTPYGRPTPDH